MKLRLGLSLPEHPKSPHAFVTEEELRAGIEALGFSSSDARRIVEAWVKALMYQARRA